MSSDPNNEPKGQNININANQVFIGDQPSVTNDNSTNYKQKNTIHDVEIDTSDSSNPPPPNPNKEKIGKIIGVIATFCTISGISVITIGDICGKVCPPDPSIIAESSETNISTASDPSESDFSETDEYSETDDSSDIVESDTKSNETSSKVDIASKPSTPSSVPTSSPNSISVTDYKIYLYSEYSKIIIGGENNMTATLNFETDEVKITAYLASGDVDTLTLNRKNSNEWGKRVIFDETGIHRIVATAVAPDGRTIEGSTEIEVIPINLGGLNLDQLFSFPN